MGKLLALELYNFKSYKGHHILHFGDSYFTSIIGPNGSGKSNSMDAISFVLGIKSSHLRSTHLRDLVYRGRVLTKSKIDANGDVVNGNGEPNGDAEGGADESESDEESQMNGKRNDPQTAWVMAVYEDDAGEEQRWKRSITSAGQSEYRINNRTVTAKQYNDALEAENILIKARNFLVFQGDVETVASQSPKDLTRLLEQISGSWEYAKEYDRLKAEKEAADEEQAHKLNQRRGINGEIRQYQQQKDELDQYEQKLDEKDQAVITSVLYKLFHFQRTIEDSTNEINKRQEELKEFRRNVQKFEDQLQKAQQDQAKVGRDVSKVEREIKRREKSVEEKENDLVPIDEKLSISSKKLATYETSSADIGRDRATQKATADKLRASLTTVQKAQARWQAEWTAQQQTAGRALSANDLAEYQNLRGEVYKQSGEDQAKADNITRQLKTDEETVNSLKSSVDRAQSSATALEDEVSALQTRRADIDRQVKTTLQDIRTKQTAINSLNSERTRTRQKQRELDEKLQQAGMKLAEGQSQQRESKKEERQREVVATMKRIFPGVRGMVHQLCHPKQKKYETALPIILGRHWDAVIVDTEKTAQACIGYLKEQRWGLVSFLPLDTIVHKQPSANLRGLSRNMKLAIDCVEFDTANERAINMVCGDDIICDDWETARDLKWNRKVDVKMVTLDGRCISKADLISGGEGPSDKKRRFEDAEVENLRTLVEKLKGDLDGLPNDHKRQLEEETLQSELSGMQQKMQYLQDELTALDRNIESKTKELSHSRGLLTEAQPKYEKQLGGLGTLRQSLEKYTSATAEVEDKVFADFCERLGYDDIREYERQQGTMQQEAKEKENDFKMQISRLESQLKYETEKLKDTETRIQNIRNKSQRDRDMIAELMSQREAIGDELDVLNAEVEELNEQLATKKSDYDTRAAKVNEARGEVKKKSKNVNKTLEAVQSYEADITRAATHRYALLRTCKVDNIDLPLEEDSAELSAMPLEDAILDETQDPDAMDVDGEAPAPRYNDHGIIPSFENLGDDLREDYNEETLTALQEEISKIQSALDKLAPNMRSADRLESTATKLRATETDFNAARAAAKSATKAFETCRNTRQSLFNKAFTHISTQILPIYRDLTKSLSWPLGGQAYLDVEDEDEPYLSGVKFHATPPGKRFRDMEHLSGGEKTMAALALLFAVHTFAPSPFFVLDEVDAALDVANTKRLASYVREKAGPGCQFVVISLKAGLFQESETLVGVLRDQGGNSSRGVTLDLRKYQAV
nr:hypothetical protein B0A51_12292 [Rachicladosporium sp. CCFEE 5018]